MRFFFQNLLPAIGLTAATLFFTDCKTTKSTNAPMPPEQYDSLAAKTAPGTLTIPVNIAIADLVRSINARVSGTIFEDNSYDDNGGDDLLMRAEKVEDIDLFLSGNALKYRVPLRIWLKKKLLLGAAVEATGDLALNFKTEFQVKEDWTLETRTDVEFHEWLKKPVLRTGLGDLGIEGIANTFLRHSKRDLSAQIDKLVREQLNLRPHIEAVWTAIQNPTLLSPEYQMWVKTTPVSIGMTPLTTDWNAIRTKITVECLNDVTFGEKPAFRENTRLPGLRITEDADDSFQLRFTTDVPFAEAERMAKSKVAGQVFGEGKQQVKVEEIELWGNGDRLVVNTKLSGAFNGKIYFTGKPVYNEKKNQIEIADLDYHLDTRSFLHKSASWLLKGILKNQMQKAMVFPLEENLAELKKSVQETLNRYEVQPGVVLTGTLDEIRVLGTGVTPTSLVVNLFSKGKLNVDVSGL